VEANLGTNEEASGSRDVELMRSKVGVTVAVTRAESVPKATTGTDAATLLGGADIMSLGSMGTLQDGITPVYKGGAAGTGIILPGTQVGIGTGGATYRWVYDDKPAGK